MNIIKIENITDLIIEIRDEKVLIDSDVVQLYGVTTKEINQAVANNPEKFPNGYLIELTKEEKQARHATSRNSGTPVTLIRSPTQRMGYALNALVSLSLIYLISCQYIKEHVNLWTS